MEDTLSNASSDTTPKQGNARTMSPEESKIGNISNPLSKKSQRKMAKAIRKESHTKINHKILSSMTRATLERTRRAKESLLKNINVDEEDSSEILSP